LKKTFCSLFVMLAMVCTAAHSPVQNCRATYHGAPRLSNGRVDIPRLVGELGEIHANTYSWLIWLNDGDWDDLQTFLPLAEAKSIDVWVTLVPPSESPPRTRRYSEPYRLDYVRWAVEIAKLSTRHRNLVAWTIDDFPYNLSIITPEKLAEIQRAAHQINPKLAFVPCCYFGQLKPKFIEQYRPLIDGVLFPYRAESSHHPNTTDASYLASEMKVLRSRLGPSIPIIVDIYATKHSQYPASDAAYVEATMRIAKQSGDGVMIYCHQDKATAPDKYSVIKRLFTAWSTSAPLSSPRMWAPGDRRF
jgi:hypothetical protein